MGIEANGRTDREPVHEHRRKDREGYDRANLRFESGRGNIGFESVVQRSDPNGSKPPEEAVTVRDKGRQYIVGT